MSRSNIKLKESLIRIDNRRCNH